MTSVREMISEVVVVLIKGDSAKVVNLSTDLEVETIITHLQEAINIVVETKVVVETTNTVMADKTEVMTAEDTNLHHIEIGLTGTRKEIEVAVVTEIGTPEGTNNLLLTPLNILPPIEDTIQVIYYSSQNKS
jgi:uncharacterized Fe-S cluster-containing radical SAM superfamily protein